MLRSTLKAIMLFLAVLVFVFYTVTDKNGFPGSMLVGFMAALLPLFLYLLLLVKSFF